MAENEYVHPENGAEVREQDINLMSHDGAIADDRTLWELLRLTHGAATPQKAVLPYGKSGWKPDLGPDNATPLTSTALVQGNVANGSVYVLPFRALIGSTFTANTFDPEYLRGQRSSYLYGATWHGRTVAVAANVSGNPRWTLVYANVTPDGPGDSANYVKKDPGTLVVSLVVAGTITVKTTVTITTVDGTPAGSPTKPTLPADGGGVYKVALAYLWIPDGFGGASAVTRAAIHEVAPCVPLHSSTGVSAVSPANQNSINGGVVDVRQGPTAVRAGAYLPSTMVGGEQRLVLMQFGVAPVSHLDGDPVDSSVDWRFRYFTWSIHYRTGTTTNDRFASDRNGAPTTPCMSAVNTTTGHGVGQSFVNDSAQTVAYATSAGTAFYWDFGTGVRIAIHVDSASGNLVFKASGGSTSQVFIKLEATAPYSNFGVV